MYSPSSPSGYSKPRENGYRSPYDDRDWDRRNREYPRDRDERDKEYRYKQRKREWTDRDYRSSLEMNPSPKRPKLDDAGDSLGGNWKPKDYAKRAYHEYDSQSSYFRSGSRSPSPPERYAYYNDFSSRFDPYSLPVPHVSHSPRRGSSSWGGDRGSSYGRYYEDMFPRAEQPPYPSEYHRSEYERDYRYYDQRYEWRDKRDERDRYNEYDREYDRDYNRDYERDYDREPRERYARGSSRERDRDRDRGDRDRDYNNHRAASNASREKEPESHQSQDSNGSSIPAEIPSPVDSDTPKPKTRLGWGKGLVAFERAKEQPTSATIDEQSQPPLDKSMELENWNESMLQPLAQGPPVPQSISPITLPPPELFPPSPRDPRSRPTDPRTSVPALATDAVQNAPQTISTPPPEPEPEGPFFGPDCPSKEELLFSIEKLDAEILKTEMLISNLKKPKKTHTHHRMSEHNLIQTVYDENRDKAAAAEQDLTSLLQQSLKGLSLEELRKRPVLYKEPSDLPAYRSNKVTHESIKGEIAAVLRKRNESIKGKEDELSVSYRKLRDKWKARIKRLELTKKRKEQKQPTPSSPDSSDNPFLRRPLLRSNRTLTPTSSPHLGRARGFSPLDVVRSEEEFHQVLSHLREEDDRDPNSKYLKTVVKVPPMILEEHKIPSFVDNNGLVLDPMAVERERKMMNHWTDAEKAIFLKKYLQYPKNFTKISSFLDNKTTSDVIYYYYTNKRTLDLKKLLREQQAKKRGLNKRIVPRELASLGVSPSVTPSPGYWSPLARSTRASIRQNINYSEEDRNRPSILGGSADPDTKWTESEREMFTEAFAKYGKDFKAISDFLGTKNPFQCKNYYHNYKKKLNADLSNDEKDSDVKETKKPKTKDKELPKGVKKEGKEEKKRVVRFWTSTEKSNFLKHLKTYGKDWKKISSLLPGRTVTQVKSFFQSIKLKLKLDRVLEKRTGDEVGQKRGRKPNKDKGPAPKRRTKTIVKSESQTSLTEVKTESTTSPSSSSKVDAEVPSLETEDSSMAPEELPEESKQAFAELMLGTESRDGLLSSDTVDIGAEDTNDFAEKEVEEVSEMVDIERDDEQNLLTEDSRSASTEMTAIEIEQTVEQLECAEDVEVDEDTNDAQEDQQDQDQTALEQESLDQPLLEPNVQSNPEEKEEEEEEVVTVAPEDDTSPQPEAKTTQDPVIEEQTQQEMVCVPTTQDQEVKLEQKQGDL